MELTVQIPDELASRMSAPAQTSLAAPWKPWRSKNSRAVASPSPNCDNCSVLEPGISSTDF
jgi:hypothetical protein